MSAWNILAKIIVGLIVDGDKFEPFDKFAASTTSYIFQIYWERVSEVVDFSAASLRP